MANFATTDRTELVELANRKGLNPFTQEERDVIARAANSAGLRVNGFSVKVAGTRNEFATVQLGAFSAEFAWQTIAHAVIFGTALEA